MCVSPPSAHQRKRTIADPISFLWFVGHLGNRPHTFTTEKYICIGSTTVRANVEAIMFTPKPHQDLGPRSHAGAGEPDRVRYV